MKITHIYAENYKTYRQHHLDPSADDNRPIIHIADGISPSPKAIVGGKRDFVAAVQVLI